MMASTTQRLNPYGRRVTGRPSRIRPGQIVVTEVAMALIVALAGRNPVIVTAAVAAATGLLLAAWVPVCRRWLYEWGWVGLRYLSRRHTLPPAASPAALLDLVAPGTMVLAVEMAGKPAAMISDRDGLTALLELGDPADLLTDHATRLPSLTTLLPATGADDPPVRIQLLLSGAPAPVGAAGNGPVATSYQQLTKGQLLGYGRAVLAVRISRCDGWSDEELRQSLSSTVRKLHRRLSLVSARLLGADAAGRVLADLAHHDGGQPGRESWSAVRLGGLVQTTFRLRRWPAVTADTASQFVSRLLALPAMATTVSVTVGPRLTAESAHVPLALTIRLAASGQADLAMATQALRRLVRSANGEFWRLDGEHLAGIAATLPLGTSTTTMALATPMLDALELPLVTAGVMVGTNRHGGPMTIRLFRSSATRILLVGGVAAAQLITLRAMALGARVVVRTSRPHAWEPFVRGVTVPGDIVAIIPPGHPVGGPPGTPLRPLLVVLDAGSMPTDPSSVLVSGWQTTLVVRDTLTPADGDVLAQANLAVLQPLRPGEAVLAGSILGLGESAQWLTRIRPDMVAVINRRALRWARLVPTPIETQLVGQPSRR